MSVQTELEAVYPATIVVGATSYACAGLMAGQTEELQDGGFVGMFDAAFLVRRSVIGTAPTVGTTITSGGRSYRVSRVSDDANNPVIRLGCMRQE